MMVVSFRIDKFNSSEQENNHAKLREPWRCEFGSIINSYYLGNDYCVLEITPSD